ncbi:Holliday junction resolvase RuvX [Phaeovibrio sulfidiphilus]|uniref:Putative pre-16S rRNA nuclease n=1 Tax=Phaeovibrio sulfidiphilus TaxID=1220600 RepID=A0A8J6YWM3_9PROT|nr:Holliday junction resolvase RuvX [Phaeovibrio sulfidiphilus]MBE1237017.1 Holliday junction resolvase RuvX [Phaeovibrio sulfidiphilus]
MPVLPLEEFRSALPAMRCLVGLDPGTRTIGVAVSDLTRMIASPVTTIQRTKLQRDLEELGAILADRNPAGLVMGLPLEMDGGEGRRAQSVRAFGSSLMKAFDLPLLYWDERLSTSAVERTLIGEADLTRKRRKEVVDRAAAAYILQGVLDRLSMGFF